MRGIHTLRVPCKHGERDEHWSFGDDGGWCPGQEPPTDAEFARIAMEEGYVKTDTGPTFMGIAAALRDVIAPSISDDDLGYLIENETGAPGFFQGEPTAEFAGQIASVLMAAAAGRSSTKAVEV